MLMNLNLQRDKPRWDQVVEEAVSQFDELATLGIDQVMLTLPNVTDPPLVRRLGRALGARGLSRGGGSIDSQAR